MSTRDRHYRVYGVTAGSALTREGRCRVLASKWSEFLVNNAGEFDVLVLSSRWNSLFEHSDYLGKHLRQDALVSVNEEHQQILRDYETDPSAVLSRSRENARRGLRRTIDFAHALGKTIFVFSQAPLSRYRVDFCDGLPKYLFSNFDLNERCGGPPSQAVRDRGAFMDNLIRSGELAPAHGVIVHEAYCGAEDPKCTVWADGKRFYKDDNHLSPEGAIFLAKWWETRPNFPFEI